MRTTSQVGSIAKFGFGTSVTKMSVDKLVSNQRIEWTCVSGPDEWINTHLFFDLSAEGNDTILHFGQRDWKSASDFYRHCNTKWSYFLHSLKSYIETGRGTPFPDDVKI